MCQHHVREAFDHPDYIFELKHDGFRAVAYLQDGECRLISRNQRNLGFDVLKRSLAMLPRTVTKEVMAQLILP